jgi:hypothetical protein
MDTNANVVMESFIHNSSRKEDDEGNMRYAERK